MKHAHVVTVDEAHSVEHFTWVKHASLASCRGWDTSPVMERSFDIFLLSASVWYVMVRVKFNRLSSDVCVRVSRDSEF